MVELQQSGVGVENKNGRGRRTRIGRGSLTIEMRAVLAAKAVMERGWSISFAAHAFATNASYVAIALHVSDDDRDRLANGTLKISGLHADYRRRLAQRRSEVPVPVGAARLAQVVEQALDYLGPVTVIQQLDDALQRRGRDLMAMIDDITTPTNGVHTA
jgi:hypothetical protein